MAKVRGSLAGALVLMGVSVLVASPAYTTAASDRGAVYANVERIGWDLHRDCGFRVPRAAHPGTSLWFYCDTSARDRKGKLLYSSLRGTAAFGVDTPGRATRVTDLGPFGFPRALLPLTPRPCPGGTPKLEWLTGAIAVPGSTIIVLPFVTGCILGRRLAFYSWGIAEFDDRVGRVVAQKYDIFTVPFGSSERLPPELYLEAPVLANGYLYLYAPRCVTPNIFGSCTSDIYVARVPVATANDRSWRDPAAYQWRSGMRWVSQSYRARSIIDSAQVDRGVSVMWFPRLRRYLLLERIEYPSPRYRIWQSTDPTAGFTVRTSGVLPGRCRVAITAPCYGFILHPELSTATHIAISYYDTYDRHVHIGLVPS